jgi:hypothetical protein
MAICSGFAFGKCFTDDLETLISLGTIGTVCVFVLYGITYFAYAFYAMRHCCY